jgi:phosphomannomutase
MDRIDKIFRAYDIRGIYPSEVNEKIADRIGRAFVRTGKIKNMVIGQDDRFSSKGLFEAVCEGSLTEGVNIIDIGTTTTPMFYYAVIKLNSDGGIMVTASHNPLEYNGFKIVKKNGALVGKKSFDEIKKVVKLSSLPKNSRENGSISKKDILNDYIENILSYCNAKNISDFKVNMETGNKIIKAVVSKLASKLPIILTQKKTMPANADLGFAFDSDGDRVVFFDKKKGRIEPDIIAAILIHYCFSNSGKIIYTAASSKIIKEEVECSNNKAICSKVGHIYVKELMIKEKAAFGCEPSGHYYFKNIYCADSPLIVLLKVLEVMSQTKLSFSELVNQFQKYYLKRVEFKIKNTAQAESLLKKEEKKYKKIRYNGRIGKISHLDGLTVEYNDWWFNLRISNTEPVVRLTIEANTKKSIPSSFSLR